jgi:predicted secreted protein
MLKTNGIYISRMDMFDHDLQFFVHGFEFGADHPTKYAIEVTPGETGDWRFKVAGLRNGPIQQTCRNYLVTPDSVEFELCDDSSAPFPFWSKWIGRIEDSGSLVTFKVITPDYTDIDGVYEFVSHETVGHIPRSVRGVRPVVSAPSFRWQGLLRFLRNEPKPSTRSDDPRNR